TFRSCNFRNFNANKLGLIHRAQGRWKKISFCGCFLGQNAEQEIAELIKENISDEIVVENCFLQDKSGLISSSMGESLTVASITISRNNLAGHDGNFLASAVKIYFGKCPPASKFTTQLVGAPKVNTFLRDLNL